MDELARLPEVAECYGQWNELRDELERYYKDAPREHKPFSQQKEFKAIKNMVIREAEELRLGVQHLELPPADVLGIPGCQGNPVRV